jgi:hypothetical protein
MPLATIIPVPAATPLLPAAEPDVYVWEKEKPACPVLSDAALALADSSEANPVEAFAPAHGSAFSLSI